MQPIKSEVLTFMLVSNHGLSKKIILDKHNSQGTENKVYCGSFLYYIYIFIILTSFY